MQEHRNGILHQSQKNGDILGIDQLKEDIMCELEIGPIAMVTRDEAALFHLQESDMDGWPKNRLEVWLSRVNEARLLSTERDEIFMTSEYCLLRRWLQRGTE